ncbi:hypothetical protein BDD12DRAFT_800465 [Trichophaea hybrida]|nr:hypothetical protein BDD12DRAFT_800465 [Trichophaea hybrida]
MVIPVTSWVLEDVEEHLPLTVAPTLEVFQWYYTPSNSLTNFLNLNELLPRLKEFTAQCYYAELDFRNEVPEEIAPLKLTELLLTPGFDLSTVTSLEFRISGEWLGFLFSVTKNLKSFIYDDEDEYDYTLPDFLPSQFLAALMEFHAPHIARNESTIGPFAGWSSRRVIDALPPNVVSLSLGCKQDYFTDVTRWSKRNQEDGTKNLS